VIAGEHADAAGTYVALTRAREQTHVYASAERLEAVQLERDGNREQQLARLAEQLRRTEEQLPSISIPLAHEQQVEADHSRESLEPERQQAEPTAEKRVEASEPPAELEHDRGGQTQEHVRQAEAEQERERVEPERVDDRHQVGVERQGEAELVCEQYETGRVAAGGLSRERTSQGAAHLTSERTRGPERDQASPTRWKHPDSDLADRHEEDRHVGDASQPRLSKVALAMQQNRSSPSVTQHREEDQSMATRRQTQEQALVARAKRGELVNDEPAKQDPEPESRAAQIMRESREREQERER